MRRRVDFLVLVGVLGFTRLDEAQSRPSANLVTHSEVTIQRRAAAIWPFIVDPSGWKQGAILRSVSGPAGQTGEVLAAFAPADPATVLFYLENVEVEPNRRRTIKLYSPQGALIGYASWMLREAGGHTVVGYDVYTETVLGGEAASRSLEQLREAERSEYAANKRRFDAELVALKRLVETGR